MHAGLERTLIHKEDIKSICRVVRDTAERYVGQLESGESQHAVRCDLSSIKHHDRFIAPGPEIRQLEYCSGRSRRTAAVQVTLEPVLSFRQARGGFESELVGNDVRTTVVGWIQESLDREGLGKYGAGPGGRTSIDITLEQLGKASALQFLIDHLRLGGSRRRGQPFGSNAIYFGDEVMVGGGNGYPVTRIPGLMVFAVNPTRTWFHSCPKSWFRRLSLQGLMQRRRCWLSSTSARDDCWPSFATISLLRWRRSTPWSMGYSRGELRKNYLI